MRLGTMAFAIESQANDSAYKELSFEERFSILLDAEFHQRESNKLQQLIRSTAFRYPNACMEDDEYHSEWKLDKSLLTDLSSCNFIGQGHHIILEGPAGNGKTFIACALGNAACRNFKKVKYIRLPELLGTVSEAIIDRIKHNAHEIVIKGEV